MDSRTRIQTAGSGSGSPVSIYRRWVVASLLTVLMLWLHQAGADTVMCNRTADKEPLSVAMVFYSGNALWSGWTSRGWHRLEPGECQQVLSGGNMVEQTIYLSILRVLGDKDRVLATSPGDDTEEFFCVRGDRGYELERESLAGLRECPDGYFLQLFNSQFETRERGKTIYTVR
ncbi:MAG: DUF1036 domain-containing protein [Thiogranum sp.]